MKTRVLFFDDEPQTSRKLRACLEKNGYVVITPNSFEEVLHEINFKKAELIIHSAHRTKTYWSLCDQIFAQYPQFPSIHFATGPDAEQFQKSLTGPFHQKLRPLIAERDFLKRVRKLLFIGRLERENLSLKKALALNQRADELFSSLDLLTLKKQIVDFFGREFGATNTVFLSPGAYGYYLQEMWKVSSLGTSELTQVRKHSIVSAKPHAEADLSATLNLLSSRLPRDWELRKTRSVVDLPTAKRSFCLFPLIGHQSQKILGHVLLIDPLFLGDNGLEKSMKHILTVIGRHLEHVVNFSGAKNLNYVDDLTELYNQRYLKIVLEKEISRCKRGSGTFSILFMDIDHFKKVNDTKGHITGSKVLIELSKVLSQNIRDMDYGFRYGGDEFILLLVGTGSEQAFSVAERIRKKIEETPFDVDGSLIKVTLSIGIATYPDHALTREEVIELADRAMYCGKNKSRNVVYVAS